MYGGKCVMIKIYAVVIKMTSSWINILCEWCRNRLNCCYIQINAYGFPKSSPTSSLQGAAFILTGISTSRDCVDPRQWLPLPSLRLFAGPEVSLWKYLCQPHLFKHWWLDIRIQLCSQYILFNQQEYLFDLSGSFNMQDGALVNLQ